MKITIEHKEKGNPQRGYHNTDTTVTFEYTNGSHYDMKHEKEIVDFILGSTSCKMWYRYTREEEIVTKAAHQNFEVKTGAVYVVNHGFDSGD